MARTKIQCHYCGKYRAESSNYANLCDVCAKKLTAGMISPDDIDRRWELIKKLDYEKPIPTQPEPIPTIPESIPTQPEPIPTIPESIPTIPESIPTQPEPIPTQPAPASASTPTSDYNQNFEDDDPDDEIRYYCDVCGAELKRGAYKCPKCDVVNDWRNTDLVDDPDVVICDTCGAITDGKRCHNCGGGYD